MEIKSLIEKMTLEEKAGMCSGADFWRTKNVERLGIPATMVSDGPHGLRKQVEGGDHLGIKESIKAVCFPAACATACSFDRDLLYDMGAALGEECQAEGISVLLGPGVNIKRSPLCGRNFEYISEDPYVSGELAASYINGVQSQNIGTSIKHFAVNNQEYQRMYCSSEIDERTLREIYYTPFERAIKKANPWTVMCSYNKINGIYASENKQLLNDLLREEWGYKGYVISDWSAVSDRVLGVSAGMDLEMPSSHGTNDQEIIKAVNEGRLSEETLNRTVERILNIVFKYNNSKKEITFNIESHHKKAVEIAKKCIVLLKNESVLPLNNDEKVAFIGGFATKPRYQGGGSSFVNSYKVISAMDLANEYGEVVYAKGFSENEDIIDENLFNEAITLIEDIDKVVVFAGLPNSFESEGYDRTHMKLPNCQNELIDKLCKMGKKVIVVLHNGSPVELPWINDVKGVLEVYLGGEGVGEATLDILYGKSNPCGKLAESFPIRLEDNPSYLNFPGASYKVKYSEGVFVGYRYYDTKKMNVLFPFGYGLSYTTFEYSNLKISNKNITYKDKILVSVDITNTGGIAGKEIVQLYISDKTKSAVRPIKELKGFESIKLEPKQRKTVTFEIETRDFSWYNIEMSDWYAASGEYEILIGKSSRDIVLKDTMYIKSNIEPPYKIDKDVMIGELLGNENTKAYAKDKLMPFIEEFLDEIPNSNLEEMIKFRPLRALRSFTSMTNDELDKIVNEIKIILK